MELKEVIALTKRWAWLVILLTVAAFAGSYYGLDKLPIAKGKDLWSSASKFELPRDSLRIVAHRESGSAKRIIIDANTEIAQIASDQNVRSASRYFTLLSILRARVERENKDAPEREHVIEREYRALLERIAKEATTDLTGTKSSGDRWTPSEYVSDFSATEEELAAVDPVPAKEGLALADRLRPIAERQARRFEDLSLKVTRDGTSRVVIVEVANAAKASEARLWCDAVVLAAIRESYQRVQQDVIRVIEDFERSLNEEMHEPDPARSADLMRMASETLALIAERAKNMRDMLAANEGGEGPALQPLRVELPVFKSKNQVMEQRTFYQELIKLIEAEYPEVASDARTGTAVGAVESDQFAVALTRLRDYERQRTELGGKLNVDIAYESRQLSMEKGRFTAFRLDGKPEEYVPNRAIINTTEMANAREEITRLDRERDELSQRFQNPHGLMVENSKMRQVAIWRWVEAVEEAFIRAEEDVRSREAKLRGQLATVMEELGRWRFIAAGLRVKLYELRAVFNIYDDAVQQFQASNTAHKALTNYGSELMKTRREQSPVILPFAFSTGSASTASKANKWQISGVVAVVVFVGSIVMVYVLTLARNKITTEYDVRRHLNLPVLTKLGRRPASQRSLMEVSPRSHVAESFSTIATLLRSYAKELSLKSILVTSAVKEEGKTDIVCNLGIALARKGLRVLIIDADYHRSRVKRFFNVNETNGTLQFVDGGMPLAECVTPSPAEGLDLLLPGGEVNDPVRLLECERFRDMMKQAESDYDLVVFDSPPVARVGDALILASEVDATVFVVSSGDVTFADATLAKRLLTSVQANLLGVILNNAKDERSREYYNYYYGGTRRKVRKVVD